MPGVYQAVDRADEVVVRGLDRHRTPVSVMVNGYVGRCLLHELNHLDGLLYLDLPHQRARRDVLRMMARVREETVARRTRRALAPGLRT